MKLKENIPLLTWAWTQRGKPSTDLSLFLLIQCSFDAIFCFHFTYLITVTEFFPYSFLYVINRTNKLEKRVKSSKKLISNEQKNMYKLFTFEALKNSKLLPCCLLLQEWTCFAWYWDEIYHKHWTHSSRFFCRQIHLKYSKTNQTKEYIWKMTYLTL